MDCQLKDYEQEFFAQKTPYLQWLKAQEAELKRHYQGALGKQVQTLPFSSCMDCMQDCGEFQEDGIYLFVRKQGCLSNYAAAVFAEAFDVDTDTVLVYADEDYRGSLKALYGIGTEAFSKEITRQYCMNALQGDLQSVYYRGEPWFKPDYSPDTLASFFYIGSIFAIRGARILSVTGEYGKDISIYEMVYRIFMAALDRKGIVHIPRVLYTNDNLADAKQLECSEQIKAFYQKQVVDATTDKVSIVIPSKDNAAVLKKCLETLIQYTNYGSYEIIIVDNGSNAEQRMCVMDCINALKKQKSGHAVEIQYLYQEMEFNFSAMCNLGARSAGGRFLLFLNDDIEIMASREGRTWLERMLLYARKDHVGAVGAKLYYPGGNQIQHAGITNMGIGPAHKLGGMADAGCLYHGHNTINYDMLAVTGACMLIRKSVFEEAGCFDETFPIAYNDVELCFRLYERGYFNVQVNEAVLIHHESLSRGQDTSSEKQKRLAVDKKRLYERHALLNAQDPFYSPNLVQWKKDAEYNTGYLYDYDRQNTPVLLEDDGESGKRKQAVFKRYDRRNWLQQRCRYAAKIYERIMGYQKILFQIDSIGYHMGNVGCNNSTLDNMVTSVFETDDVLTIEGWCAVRDTDNASIFRKLWLICRTRNVDYRNVYEFDIKPKLREDVAALLEKTQSGANSGSKSRKRETKNTALAGIQVNINRKDLKPGTYQIGVLCNNKLVCDMEKNVKITDSTAGDTKKAETES